MTTILILILIAAALDAWLLLAILHIVHATEARTLTFQPSHPAWPPDHTGSTSGPAGLLKVPSPKTGAGRVTNQPENRGAWRSNPAGAIAWHWRPISPLAPRPSAIGHWLSAIGYWPLAIGHWLSSLVSRPSAIGYWPLAIVSRLSSLGYRLLAIGSRLSSLVPRLSAIGHWLSSLLFFEVRCAWCPDQRVLKRAWLWPRATSHGICHRCAIKWSQSHQSHKSH